jgi:hypothetical protein
MKEYFRNFCPFYETIFQRIDGVVVFSRSKSDLASLISFQTAEFNTGGQNVNQVTIGY